MRFDQVTLSKIFDTVNPQWCSISEADDVFRIINGAAYRDMQPRHFAGIGNYREQREAVFHELSKRFVDLMNSSFEESLNRLSQTKRDILYMYLWERHSMASVARMAGYENARIEQIISVCHRRLAHDIAGSMRR